MAAPTIAAGISAASRELGRIDSQDPVWQVLMEAFVQSRRHPRLADMAIGLLEAYRTALAERLSEAVARGELPESSDVEGLAVALTAMVDGLGLHAWVDPEIDAPRAGEAVARLLGGTGGEERT